jgi:esterase/lipase superfamily enzyme
MSNEIIGLFKRYYTDLMALDFSQLDQLYDERIHFKDPIHEIRGLPSLQDYFMALCSNLQECRFEFLDICESENTAYIKWNMHYRHPKLQSGKLLTLKGVSQIQFNQRITYHEDFYDVAAMVYDHLPIMGMASKAIKKRLMAN